jgi:hypothetical protein
MVVVEEVELLDQYWRASKMVYVALPFNLTLDFLANIN